MKSINKAVEIFAHTMRNVLRRNSIHFAAALLVALASFVAAPNAALAAAAQHHDQVPGFLVNTGKQLILVDAGAGTWWGGGALGRLAGSLRSAGYAPEEVDIVLLTRLHSDHVGGLTTQDGKRVFSNAAVYVAKAESDF